MIQEVEQTRDEKVAMYMKLTKRQLVEMLINANLALASRSPSVEIVPKSGTDHTTVTGGMPPPIWDGSVWWG